MVKKNGYNSADQSYLYPAERASLIMMLLAVVLFNIYELPLRKPFVLYGKQITQSVPAYPFALFVAFTVLLLVEGVRSRRRGEKPDEKKLWRKFRGDFLNWRSILRDFRLLNAIMLMFVAFAQLKHLIPHINPRLWDHKILAFETLLLGGANATEIFISVLGAQSAELWSGAYVAYYGYVALVLFILVLQRNLRLGQEYCLAFIYMWLMGTLLMYLIPTWGPVFYVPESVAGLPATSVSEMQDLLWKMKLYLDQNPFSSEAMFAISGLPSLHFAVALLGTYYLHKLGFWFGLLSWVFVAATFVSTIYFGWHYVVDDIAAIFLACVSIWVAKAVMRSADHSNAPG